jgi:hypothetical protein
VSNTVPRVAPNVTSKFILKLQNPLHKAESIMIIDASTIFGCISPTGIGSFIKPQKLV